jgi:hypothetical protein
LCGAALPHDNKACSVYSLRALNFYKLHKANTMPYIAIKHLHVTFAALSLIIFIIRGVWLATDNQKLHSKFFRVLPHIVYTLLLLCGIALATLSGQWDQGWIWTKIVLLFVVVGFGVPAFKRHSTIPRSRRISLWGLGLLVFIMIFAVVAYHHAMIAPPPPGAIAADPANIGASTPAPAPSTPPSSEQK